MSQDYKFYFLNLEQEKHKVLNAFMTALKKEGYQYYKKFGYFDVKQGDLVKGSFVEAKKSILSNGSGGINFIKRDEKLGSFGFINLSVFFAFKEKWIGVTFDSTYTRLPDYEKNRDAIRDVILALKSVVQCEKIVEGYINHPEEYTIEKSLNYLKK